MVLGRVNLVEFKFQVDSFRDYGTYSGYENVNTNKIHLTPATRTFLFLKYFKRVLKNWWGWRKKYFSNVLKKILSKTNMFKKIKNSLSPSKDDWLNIEHIMRHRTYNHT